MAGMYGHPAVQTAPLCGDGVPSVRTETTSTFRREYGFIEIIPTTFLCPHCIEQRPIRLYITDRKALWLHTDDVAWAVRYLYVQNHLKVVPVVDPESRGPECSAVAE